ncbi:YmdB family metallophosphoesterase [Candidatus Gracilibacteria bacterium 28_42_T64]|nr:YmdB family metallophosphoesterase [Candidatus Gracilibacteria bacterium 28_42_T64]
MKVLVFGDVYGRVGRGGIKKELPGLIKKHKPDFIIANIENITSGRGPIEKHVLEIEDLGVDVMTGGDHFLDNLQSIYDYLEKTDSKLIRPANFYEQSYYKIPGKGYKIVEKNGKKLLVIHLIANTFMKFDVYNPFLKVQEILKSLENEKFDGIFIDFHKETTSEGYGMAYLLDGKASFVFGTHTHIQTNDELILPQGTGLISDVGMNGPLYSVIGADFESVKKRFLTGLGGKIEQNLGNDYVVNGVCVEIGDHGKCETIEKIRIRSKL